MAKEGRLLGRMELGLDSIADKVVFGRAPTCDVVVEHLSCSRAHAQARPVLALLCSLLLVLLPDSASARYGALSGG